MSHKFALAAASLAATVTLTVALAAAGFAPGTPRPADAATATVTAADPTADPTTDPGVQVDTVYVAAPPAQQTVTVHRVVKSAGGENDGEHGSGGDD